MKTLFVWGAGIPFLIVMNFFVYDMNEYTPKFISIPLNILCMLSFIISMSIIIVFAGREKNINKKEE